MDLDLTVAQTIIRDTAAALVKREVGPILRDLNRPRHPKRYCIKEAAMATGSATEAANHACHDAMPTLGGYGTIQKLPVERLYRNVRVTTISFGTSGIQHLIIARESMQ